MQKQQLFNLVNAQGDMLLHIGNYAFEFTSAKEMQALNYEGLISFISPAYALDQAKKLNITCEVIAIECTV